MHTMMEMLQRLMEGSQSKNKGTDFDMLGQPIEALYRDLADFAPAPSKNDKS